MPIVERPYVAGYQQEQSSDKHTGPIIIPVPQPPVRDPIIVTVVQPPTQQPERIIIHEESTATVRSETVRNAPVREQKEFARPNKKSSPEVAQTVREPNKSNSPDELFGEQKELGPRIDSELFEPLESAPQADIPAFKKVGKVGRQRRYETLGIDDIEPIKEVVLFRYQMGKHWPGLSKDMEAYYERMYFLKPRKGEKDYDKHRKCWDRRTRWINPTSTTNPPQS